MAHRTQAIANSIMLGLSVLASTPLLPAQNSSASVVTKLGVDQDVRSGMKILMDETLAGTLKLPDFSSPVTHLDWAPPYLHRGVDVQANVPSGDYVQQFPGFRPFVRATQSEVSTAAFGRNIVVGYNNSVGIHVSPSGPGLIVDRVQISGYSASNDGGQTWKSGFLPPSHNASQTFGDPSVGVDRRGVFYYATLAADSTGRGTVQVNSSKDGGATWSEGAIVQQDDGADKEWLAIGRDPERRNRDNIYVTWTSFQKACELRFGRSTDGGATWQAKTIFVPATGLKATDPTDCLQFSNPVVDATDGTLYVPFLRFSNADQDFIQMMISEDAGETFRFAKFNVPGAPSPTVLPVTQPGELTSCGANNIRNTIHGNLNSGPGQFGFPRYVNASRLTLQPAAAAYNGSVFLAWNNSASLVFGSAAGSDVWFIRSDDSARTWKPKIKVNPSTGTDKHHVLPSLALGRDDEDLHISYYTQHADSSIDLEMANSSDAGDSFPARRIARITDSSFQLPPTNLRLSNAPAFGATNYDRQIAVCYALGEYQSVTTTNGAVYVGWGDSRNLITEPLNTLDPISGQTHPEQDVFVQRVRVQ